LKGTSMFSVVSDTFQIRFYRWPVVGQKSLSQSFHRNSLPSYGTCQSLVASVCAPYTLSSEILSGTQMLYHSNKLHNLFFLFFWPDKENRAG
jgi:hypothetical protein